MLEEVVKNPREKKIFDLVIHFGFVFNWEFFHCHFISHVIEEIREEINETKIILSDCCGDKLCIDLLRNRGTTTFCDNQKMLLFVVILKCLSDVCGFAVFTRNKIWKAEEREKAISFYVCKRDPRRKKKLKGIFVTKRVRDKFKHFDCFFRVSTKKKTKRWKRQEILKNRFSLCGNSHTLWSYHRMR